MQRKVLQVGGEPGKPGINVAQLWVSTGENVADALTNHVTGYGIDVNMEGAGMRVAAGRSGMALRAQS